MVSGNQPCSSYRWNCRALKMPSQAPSPLKKPMGGPKWTRKSVAKKTLYISLLHLQNSGQIWPAALYTYSTTRESWRKSHVRFGQISSASPKMDSNRAEKCWSGHVWGGGRASKNASALRKKEVQQVYTYFQRSEIRQNNHGSGSTILTSFFNRQHYKMICTCVLQVFSIWYRFRRGIGKLAGDTEE